MKFNDLYRNENIIAKLTEEIRKYQKNKHSFRKLAKKYAKIIPDATEQQIYLRIRRLSKLIKAYTSKIPAEKLSVRDCQEEKTEKEAENNSLPDNYAEEPRFISGDKKVKGRALNLNPDGSYDSEDNFQYSQVITENGGYNEDELLKLHGFDTKHWELSSAKHSFWDGQKKGGEIIKMTSSRITVRPKVNVSEAMYQAIADAQEYFGRLRFNHPTPPIKKDDADICAIVPFADFHLNKRADNDSSLPSFAKQVQDFYKMLNWFYTELYKIRRKIKKVVFYWSQDFFNFDYMTEETTSRKNKQDGSVGYKTMVTQGQVMLVNAIKKLEEIAPVELFYTRSNHDEHTSFDTMCSLYTAFLYDENVIIDGMNSKDRQMLWKDFSDKQMAGEPISQDILFNQRGRSYLMWGEVLMGFSHGDTEKNNIKYLMANEASRYLAVLHCKRNGIEFGPNDSEYSLEPYPEQFAWNKTRVHIFFCGHYHSKRVFDDGGVEVNYLASEMSGDTWHDNCGFNTAHRKAELFLVHKDGDVEHKTSHAFNFLKEA